MANTTNNTVNKLEVGDILAAKSTYTKQGLPKVKVDFDKISYGVWEGKPSAACNLH